MLTFEIPRTGKFELKQYISIRYLRKNTTPITDNSNDGNDKENDEPLGIGSGGLLPLKKIGSHGRRF